MSSTPLLGLVLTPDGSTNWGTDQRNNLTKLDTFSGTTELTVNKGASNGYASLSGGSIPTVQLGNVPNAISGVAIEPSNINTGSISINDTAGNMDLWLQNGTAATASASQNSVGVEFVGSYWTGTAAGSDGWTMQSVIASGTNGASVFTITHSGSSSTASGIALVSGGTREWMVSTQGRLTSYNGEATAGLGQPYMKGATVQKIETGADSNLLTASVLGGGIYRVSFAASVSAASGNAVLGWTVSFIDSNGTNQNPTNIDLNQVGALTPNLTAAVVAGGTYSGEVVLDCAPGLANTIVVKTTFQGTSVTYKASAIVERIG